MNRFLPYLAIAIVIGAVAWRQFTGAADAGPSPSDDLPWFTDAPAALAQAKAENKTVVMDFTGSDWCPWCVKLDHEVFSAPEFADYSAKNLVLVKVDFPRRKQQTDAEKRQNAALAQKYAIEGYPTVVVLNASGKEVGRLGYMPGGAKAWLAELERITKS